jgi:penicillin V acylase-like amidase (Ntn superfamily)
VDNVCISGITGVFGVLIPHQGRFTLPYNQSYLLYLITLRHMKGILMCTTFKLKNSQQLTLSQNYDFYYGHGLVIVNKQGIKKVALCDALTTKNLYDNALKTPRWVSQYGSITFNQFSREIPTCGVNEKGLAIASMWHDTKNVNKAQTDNSITELQWIQYQLDCYSTLDEVIKNLSDLDVRVEIYPMHYSICDAKGNSGVIEIKQGKLHAYHPLKHHACSNAGIEASIEYSRKHDGQAPEDITIKHPILDRASKALHLTQAFNESTKLKEAVSSSFNILDSVSLPVGFKDLFKWVGKGIPPSQTFWQIVFDLSAFKIHFKTKENKNIRSIDILAFDYSNASAVQVLNIEGENKGKNKDKSDGDVSKLFHDYQRFHNEKIVKTSFKLMKDVMPLSEQTALIEYPELLTAIQV